MAEGDGLENRCVSNGTGGSNPSPSALVCVVTLRVQCRDTFLCTSHVVGGVVLTVAGFSAKTCVWLGRVVFRVVRPSLAHVRAVLR